jgi:hypothetical protein
MIIFSCGGAWFRDSAEMTRSFNDKPQATMDRKTQSPAACR